MPWRDDPNGWDDPEWIAPQRRLRRYQRRRQPDREPTDAEIAAYDERLGIGDGVADDYESDRLADAYEREIESHFP